MILCGDMMQSDLEYDREKKNKLSGFPFVIDNICNKIPDSISYELKTNHRSKIVEDILDCYEKRDK
jgi:hypothetical protein